MERYFDKNGKELNMTPYNGEVYLSNGQKVTLKNGKVDNGPLAFRDTRTGQIIIGGSDPRINQPGVVQIYGNAPYKEPAPAPTPAPVAKDPVAPTYNVGGGSSNVRYLTGTELANKFGIKASEADLYKTYSDAVNAQFNETDTQMTKAKEDSLRAMQTAYEQQLQDARTNRANAVATGISKGTAAAQQLASILGWQQTNAANQQMYADTMLQLGNQRGTALANAKVQAQTDANAIGQYLAQTSAAFDANNVGRYQADATTRAAGITASGSTNLAQYNFDLAKSALIRGGMSEKDANLLLGNAMAPNSNAK